MECSARTCCRTGSPTRCRQDPGGHSRYRSSTVPRLQNPPGLDRVDRRVHRRRWKRNNQDLASEVNCTGQRMSGVLLWNSAPPLLCPHRLCVGRHIFSPLSGGGPHSSPECVQRFKSCRERTIQELSSDSCIGRTSWLFGAAGPSFREKILRASESRKELTVVSDQVGSPTFTRDLAAAILQLVHLGGTRHRAYHKLGHVLVF